MPLPDTADGITETLDLTIFVPCYNEAPRIEGTLDTIQSAHSGMAWTYEVIVVDDGSTDGTAEKVEDYRRRHPEFPLHLKRNPGNLGLARSFVDTAFCGKGRYYRLVCGDNVEPAETMRALAEKLGQSDLVLPYYPILPGKSRSRKLISATFTFLVNTLSGHSIHYYNGCALYRRYHVMRWAPYNYGFGFQADLITTLLDEGARYLEIPVTGYHVEKKRAASPLNFRNFVSTGHTLFEILLRRIRFIIFSSKVRSR